MTEEEEFKVTSITIGVAQRCPTCGELPPDFRDAFTRRVENNYIIPKRSVHYSADKDGVPFEYIPSDPSPAGLYPSVVVPEQYLGKVVLIKLEGE